MKTLTKLLVKLSVLALILAVTTNAVAQEAQGTTVKRNADGCTVDIILQVAVDGTATEVADVRTKLQNCFSALNCKIPCDNGSANECDVDISVVVIAKSAVANGDEAKYHQVKMNSDPNHISNATLSPPNGASGRGEWKSNALADIYCHEALHLMGLEDQYCDRRYQGTATVNGRSFPVITEKRDCVPGPNPNGGNCCTPTAADTRCTEACPGFTGDIMAELPANATCTNILAVVTLAGLNSCPVDPCCPLDSSSCCLTDEADGGFIAVTTNPCSINVPTLPGESAITIAGNMVNAINNDPCFNSIDVGAVQKGNCFVVFGPDGTSDNTTFNINDPGLQHTIPAVSTYLLALLILMMLSLGYFFIRQQLG